MNRRIEERLVLKKSIKNVINKVLLTVIIFLLGMILIKKYPNIKTPLQTTMFEESFKFQTYKSFYEKYFGNILSVNKITKKTEPVFNEKLNYKKISKYKNGVKLEVDNNYMIPIIESGVVVFIGEKEDLGNTIVVEQTDGIYTIYGNVINNDIKLYDYVEKGKTLGEAKENTLYIIRQKDGKYLEYSENI